MARASFYDFSPDTFCFFCGETTEETVPVRHHVDDLPSGEVAVRAHRRCYSRRVGGLCVLTGAIFVVTAVLLGLLEAGAFRAAYGQWTALPPLLVAADVVAGLFVAAGVGIQLARDHHRQLNDHVQLRTYPYP